MISDLLSFLSWDFLVLFCFVFILKCPNLVHTTETSSCSASVHWGEHPYYGLISRLNSSCKAGWPSILGKSISTTQMLLSPRIHRMCGASKHVAVPLKPGSVVYSPSISSFILSSLIWGHQNPFPSKWQHEQSSIVHRLGGKILMI